MSNNYEIIIKCGQDVEFYLHFLHFGRKLCNYTECLIMNNLVMNEKWDYKKNHHPKYSISVIFTFYWNEFKCYDEMVWFSEVNGCLLILPTMSLRNEVEFEHFEMIITT